MPVSFPVRPGRSVVVVRPSPADANQYAIGARGFSSTTANKMLTLIDGRTVYSPLFSGVFWKAQAVALEDVARIEVMSGGGGHFSVHGHLSGRDHTENAAGADIRDAATRAQAGFRADWGGEADTITLQGDVYTSDIDQGPAPGTRRIGGMNLLGRLTRQLAPGSNLQLQAYVDRTERDQPGSVRDALNTFDVEFTHRVAPGAQHALLWGGGYRQQRDALDHGSIINFVVKDGRVKFDVALDPAGNRGMRLSSRLLTVAQHVRPVNLQ